MLEPVLYVVVMALFLAIIGKEKREAPARWLTAHLPLIARGRRASNSKTPPRSLSPEKKVPNNAPGPTDYKDIFPPSPRDALSAVAGTYPQPQKSRLSYSTFEEAKFRENIIPFTANYRDCTLSSYTPMGFSIDEIKALGDFPDYAELSGVPLPQGYQEFRIKTACARPYRPFRWAYHQTMCKPLYLETEPRISNRH